MLQMFDELRNAVLDEDFYKTDVVLKKIRKEANAFEYVNGLFELIEKNPNIDFGLPGPVVHFMEQYYKNGYEELLLKSIKRCPTSQTIWMLNRVINDPHLKEKEVYLTTLENLLQKEDITENLREEIRGFLKYQKGKLD